MLSKRDLSQEKMSLSRLQANNHSWACWLAAPTSGIDWVCAPPLWPGAASQPTLGCGFVQEISAAASCRMLAGPGLGGDPGGYPAVTCGLQPLLCAHGPEQWQSWQSLPGRGKVCPWCARSPSPHSMSMSQASMGLSLGARVRHWDQQFHLAAQPWLGGYTDRSELWQEARWG